MTVIIVYVLLVGLGEVVAFFVAQAFDAMVPAAWSMIFYMALFFGVIWGMWPRRSGHHREVSCQVECDRRRTAPDLTRPDGSARLRGEGGRFARSSGHGIGCAPVSA